MKTTIDIPDELFRSAKMQAVGEGITFRQYVADALQRKLAAGRVDEPRPWIAAFGALSHLSEETRKIEHVIEEEFESVDETEWK